MDDHPTYSCTEDNDFFCPLAAAENTSLLISRLDEGKVHDIDKRTDCLAFQKATTLSLPTTISSLTTADDYSSQLEYEPPTACKAYPCTESSSIKYSASVGLSQKTTFLVPCEKDFDLLLCESGPLHTVTECPYGDKIFSDSTVDESAAEKGKKGHTSEKTITLKTPIGRHVTDERSSQLEIETHKSHPCTESSSMDDRVLVGLSQKSTFPCYGRNHTPICCQQQRRRPYSDNTLLLMALHPFLSA